MHEMSIAMEVCRIAEETVGRTALPQVTEIGVLVGRQSGVELENLRFCLETLLEMPPFREAKPVFEWALGDDLRVTYLEVDDDGPPH